MSPMRIALIGISLLLTACSAREAPSVLAGDAAAEHRRVRALLYDQGLIEDPEVQVKMSEYVVRMRRDSVRPDSGYREFREWLEEWVRANPARATAVRARRPLSVQRPTPRLHERRRRAPGTRPRPQRLRRSRRRHPRDHPTRARSRPRGDLRDGRPPPGALRQAPRRDAAHLRRHPPPGHHRGANERAASY